MGILEQFDATNLNNDLFLSGEMNLNDTGSEVVLTIHEDHGSGIPNVVLATAVIQGCVDIIGIVSNALVIFVLVFARDKQDTSSVIYVLNLAVADLLFLLTIPLKIMQDIQLHWWMGEIMCKIAWAFVTYLNFLVSALFLMVMSIDRYLAVNRAVTSAKLRAISSSRIVSCLVWFVGICAVIPLSVFHSAEGGTRCRPKFPGNVEMNGDPPMLCSNSDSAIFTLSNESDYTDISQEYYFFTNNHGALVDYYDYGVDTVIISNETKPRNRRSSKDYATTNPFIGTTMAPSSTTRKAEVVSVVAVSMEGDSVEHNFKDSILTSEDLRRLFSCRTIEESMTDIPSSTSITTLSESNDENTEVQLKTKTLNKHFVMDGVKIPRNFKCHHPNVRSLRIWVVLNFLYSFLIPSSIIGKKNIRHFHLFQSLLLIVSVTCYAAILRKLYQPSRSLHQTSGSKRKVHRHTMRKKVTLMVAVLVVTYLICFTPYYLWQIAKIPGVRVGYLQMCYHIERLTHTLTIINSAINPLLYTFLCDKFAVKFQRACQKFDKFFHISSAEHPRRSTKSYPNEDFGKKEGSAAILPREPVCDEKYNGNNNSPYHQKKSCHANLAIDGALQMGEIQSSQNNFIASREASPLLHYEGSHFNKKPSSGSKRSLTKQSSKESKKKEKLQLNVTEKCTLTNKSNVTEITTAGMVHNVDDYKSQNDNSDLDQNI